MTGSEANLMAIMFGLGVFAVILAIGWRSVQHRRILRLQDGDGQETIIVAGEDDEISSVVTSTEATQPAEESAGPDVGAAGSRSAADFEADLSGRDRLGRMVSANK